MKQPKTGLFIDKEADKEVPTTEIPAAEEGGVPTVVLATVVEGEWFYTLKARNGNVIAGNGGLNTSQGALGTIKAVRDYFKKNPKLKVYNVVTGEMESLKG